MFTAVWCLGSHVLQTTPISKKKPKQKKQWPGVAVWLAPPKNKGLFSLLVGCEFNGFQWRHYTGIAMENKFQMFKL